MPIKPTPTEYSGLSMVRPTDIHRRTTAQIRYCGSVKSNERSCLGIGSVSTAKRPRFNGRFRTKPAPKAETSLRRVISFQLVSASILDSTRTGRGSEIRWIRRFSLTTVGLGATGVMERVCSGVAVSIFNDRISLNTRLSGNIDRLLTRLFACKI